jgi:hypothetical protein
MTTFYKPWSVPSIFCVVGSTKSGKTYLTKQIIRELIESDQPVHRIFIFSPTLELSGDWDDLPDTQKHDKRTIGRIKKFEDVDEFLELIIEIFSQQQRIIKKDSKKNTPHVLLVLDDCAGTKLLTFGGYLDRISISMRHYNISAIVISQRLAGIPRQLRINSSYVILLSNYNMSEVEQFLEQFVLKRHKKALHGIINDVFGVQYNYLVSDNLNPIISQRLYKNGHERIVFPE